MYSDNTRARFPGILLFVVGFLIGVCPGSMSAQEPIGGPYEPDSSTVLLLHFNGDLSNPSEFSADGIKHGNLAFVGQSPLEEGGQSAYLDNDSPTDSTFITVADTPALDLQGSWTMEAWVNVFTYGQTNDDHRWWPRFILKPGETQFYYSNYFVALLGSSEQFRTGYYTESGDDWIQMDSQDGLMQPGNWYHIAFIRDTSEQIIAQMVHNRNRELLFFGSSAYNPITGAPPRTNPNPLVIGGFSAIDNGWFDGFVEEFRISDVVRNFGVPPIIKSTTDLANQSTEAPGYPVESEITKIGPGEITSVTLHYRVEAEWNTLDMSESEPGLYRGEIPSQERGTLVEYYVSAEDEDGLRATSPSTAETDSTYYEFAVWQPNTQTLAINFEEGSGIPEDTTLYDNTVEFVGNPAYSGDAREGNSSLDLEGDSSFVEINSPFLTSEEFTIDFWFKTDSMPPSGLRMVIREGNPWYEINYQIRFDPGGQIVPASYIPSSGTYIGGDLTDSAAVAEPQKWYRIIYQIDDTTAAFQLRDSADVVIASNRLAIDGPPIQTTGPFRLGHADGQAQAFFDGKFDAVQVFNYPRYDMSTGVLRGENGQPEKITLAQNYPNPFNPSTTIRFTLPAEQPVKLSVFDLLGRQVVELVDMHLERGAHRVTWDGTDDSGLPVSSGVYFYRLRTPERSLVQKMVLLR